MEKETHIYLADKIYKCLAPGFPTILSLDTFRAANVKPDQTCQSIIHPHFAKWSFAYIENQVTLLSQQRLHIGEAAQEDFMYCLGRITHYLCDFFCYVHIKSNLFNIREHVEYETRLSQAVMDKPGYFDRICRTNPVTANYPLKRLNLLYDQCLGLYLQQPAGFERDMTAATWISVQVAGGILSRCLCNRKTSSVRLSCAHSY